MTALRSVKPTPGGSTNTGPGPRATIVLDGNCHCVKLEASPLARAILGDLFDAMAGQGHWLVVGTRTRRTHVERQRLLDRMLEQPAVRAAFDQDITVEAATVLDADLFQATEEPDRCRVCGPETDNYAAVAGLCDDCQQRAENRSPVRLR